MVPTPSALVMAKFTAPYYNARPRGLKFALNSYVRWPKVEVKDFKKVRNRDNEYVKFRNRNVFKMMKSVKYCTIKVCLQSARIGFGVTLGMYHVM